MKIELQYVYMEGLQNKSFYVSDDTITDQELANGDTYRIVEYDYSKNKFKCFCLCKNEYVYIDKNTLVVFFK